MVNIMLMFMLNNQMHKWKNQICTPNDTLQLREKFTFSVVNLYS